MSAKIIEDTYLGDGVYASYDGYGIALDLRGQDTFTRIVLEPEVLQALNRYAERAESKRKEYLEKINENEV
jgi:hypothetical protein